MALINCYECGQMISDKAQNCPKCGCLVESSTEQLLRCPECGHSVSKYASACQNCGYLITVPASPVKAEYVQKQNIYSEKTVPDVPAESTEVDIEGKDNFLSLLLPSKGYLITPLLVYVNVIVFAVMAMLGMDIFEPQIDILVFGGANYGPLTQEGQWWRLLTSCFVHIGIIHLLLNMYALMCIGKLLEPLVGKIRFIFAYLLTGIIASAVSLFWNPWTVSAGASGAIFGMYGLFLALLTTNLIPKKTRNNLLISIGVFIAYNLYYGFTTEGIDNAAHIGGLIAGLIVGFALRIDKRNVLLTCLTSVSLLLIAGFSFSSNSVEKGFLTFS
jgi:rhomboid protease GluP